jgi:hypothetical protein
MVRYRLGKFVARNRIVVAAAALLAVAVLTGTAVSLYESYRARENELRAERRFDDVRDLANSLLFEIHDAVRNPPGSTPVRKLIVDRALKYLDSLASEANGDLSLERELATAYERVGEVQGGQSPTAIRQVVCFTTDLLLNGLTCFAKSPLMRIWFSKFRTRRGDLTPNIDPFRKRFVFFHDRISCGS